MNTESADTAGVTETEYAPALEGRTGTLNGKRNKKVRKIVKLLDAMAGANYGELKDNGFGSDAARFIERGESFFVCDGGPLSNDYPYGADDCSAHSIISNHQPKTYINFDGGRLRTMRGVAKKQWLCDESDLCESIFAASVINVTQEEAVAALDQWRKAQADMEDAGV